LPSEDAHRTLTPAPIAPHKHIAGVPVHAPASQQMPPSQLGMPEQLTLHEAPLQPTRILHEPLPVQVTLVVFATVLDTVDAHAFPPAQLTMHESPVHEMGFAHVAVPVHWISHAVAVQMIGAVQLPAPTHPTLHASPAQRMVLVHEPSPTQLMAHELAAWQST